jgi:acetoin utilization deacetylase AcuC-like enzyme
MDTPGFVLDDCYLLHDPGSRHLESPKRLLAIKQALASTGAAERWQRLQPRPAHLDELELVHTPGHLEHVRLAAKRAPSYLDPDTVVSSESYRTGLFAVGGVLECVDAICKGNLRKAFAFVRPPGHHAGPAKAMGFCLFNNVALAAAYARVVHHLERVAVVDNDLHHGNGTQAIFYDDPHVLYISSHQFPFYPGTGNFDEVGRKEGKGYTLNFPLPAGTNDSTFVPIYSKIVRPILEQYQPQLILVSAGFDAHFKDPLGSLRLTQDGYASSAASLIRAAERCCGGRICFVLEGGYSYEALTECTQAVMAEMEENRPRELELPESPLFHHISKRLKEVAGSLWKW